MNRYAFGIRLVCALAAALWSAAPAAAQGTNGNPFAGLFGSAAKGQQSLEVRGQAFGAYDDNLLALGPNPGDQQVLDPRGQSAGFATGFDSSLSYGYGRVGRSKSNSTFQFGAGAAVRGFSTRLSVGTLWVPSGATNASFRTNLTPKISFAVRSNAAYAPYYQYAPFLKNAAAGLGAAPIATAAPADVGASPDTAASATTIVPDVSPVGTDTGFVTSSQWVSMLSAGASIADRFTKRDSVALDVGVDETQIFGRTKIDTRVAHGSYFHNLTRKIAFHLGYGIQQIEYSSASSPSQRTSNHLVDFGVDYGDTGSISFGRYYTLSFSTGMSALRQADQTAFRLNGGVTLARSMGRTWSASIGAARGTEYVLGIVQPLLTDSANAGVGGPILPRLQFSAGAGYTRGQRAFFASDDVLVSKSASTKLTLAVSRHIGVYAQYSYYRYDVPKSYFFDLDFPQNFNRRSATVGLALWAPLLNRRAAKQP